MNYFRAEYDIEFDSDNYSDFMDKTTKKRKKSTKRSLTTGDHVPKQAEIDEDIYVDENDFKAEQIEEALNKIPKNRKQLQKLYETVKDRLEFYKARFIQEQRENEGRKSYVPEESIPISADVRNFDWKKLTEVQHKFGGRLFDVIMMDPPWQLSSSQPSRGVAIAYSSLSDEII